MKFKPLPLIIISLATISPLVDVHLASAQMCRSRSLCTYYDRFGRPYCRVCSRTGGPTNGGFPGTLPGTIELTPALRQRLNELSAQENYAEAEKLLLPLLGQTRDLREQAGANQALGYIYAKTKRPDLATTHLKIAETLYQKLGNSQHLSEVRVQLREIQPQIRLP